MPPAATVYLATNNITGDTYVGVTRFDPARRWTQHIWKSKSKPATHFHRAIAKYGADHFSITDVASCLSVEGISETERAVIKNLAPTYNQTNGGEITIGKRVPRDVVERVIAKNTGLKRTPEQNAAMSELKKKQYAERPELKAKSAAIIRDARKLVNEEGRRAAAGKSARERTWSAESRAKLSASCMGRKYGRDVIDKMREKKKKPVKCLATGATYASALEASAQLGIHNGNIGAVCNGKRETAGNMRFEFVSY